MMNIANSVFSNHSNAASVTFLGVMVLGNIFDNFGTAESLVALKTLYNWTGKDKHTNNTPAWHGGYLIANM